MSVRLTEDQAVALLKEVGQLKTAFQIVFGAGPACTAVLNDLARFCRAEEPTWSEDARHHARLEGRREVWLRIQSYLRATEEDLLQRRVGDSYTVVRLETKEDEANG